MLSVRSMMSVSREKRLMMRPDGFVSKKAFGRMRICPRSKLWIPTDAATHLDSHICYNCMHRH